MTQTVTQTRKNGCGTHGAKTGNAVPGGEKCRQKGMKRLIFVCAEARTNVRNQQVASSSLASSSTDARISQEIRAFSSYYAAKSEYFLYFGPEIVWVSVWVKRLTRI